MKVGFAVTPAIPLSGLGALARAAEDLGYSDVWSGEVSSFDAFTPLAAAASATRTVRCGAGVLPVFTRPPALIAMGCAAMQDLSGGRFCLGLGVSTAAIVSGWMGLSFERPVVRLRETIEALRMIFSGRRTAYAGKTVQIDGFRLDQGKIDVPIMVAALGPRMIRLAAEAADGLLLTFVAPQAAGGVLSEFWSAMDAAGRNRRDAEVVARIYVAADQESMRLREMMRTIVGTYGAFPIYNHFLRRQGFIDEADAIARGWEDSRRDGAARGVSDELLESVCVFGGVADFVRKARAMEAAGVTTLVLDIRSALETPAERLRHVESTLRSLAAASIPS